MPTISMLAIRLRHVAGVKSLSDSRSRTQKVSLERYRPSPFHFRRRLSKIDWSTLLTRCLSTAEASQQPLTAIWFASTACGRLF